MVEFITAILIYCLVTYVLGFMLWMYSRYSNDDIKFGIKQWLFSPVMVPFVAFGLVLMWCVFRGWRL